MNVGLEIEWSLLLFLRSSLDGEVQTSSMNVVWWLVVLVKKTSKVRLLYYDCVSGIVLSEGPTSIITGR